MVNIRCRDWHISNENKLWRQKANTEMGMSWSGQLRGLYSQWSKLLSYVQILGRKCNITAYGWNWYIDSGGYQQCHAFGLGVNPEKTKHSYNLLRPPYLQALDIHWKRNYHLTSDLSRGGHYVILKCQAPDVQWQTRTSEMNEDLGRLSNLNSQHSLVQWNAFPSFHFCSYDWPEY